MLFMHLEIAWRIAYCFGHHGHTSRLTCDVHLCCRFNVSQLTPSRQRQSVYPSRDSWQKRNEMKEQYTEWVRQLKGYVSPCYY